MSILIDSGETRNFIDISDEFFKPIDAIWGDYKDHNAIPEQFLKDENGGQFSLTYSEVSGSNTFGIALSITKEELADDGACITRYKIEKEIVWRDKVEDYIANHQPTGNQLGPTLLLTKEHLEKNDTLKESAFGFRIGKYKDGRYVLFLHSGTSEVHNPVRVPSE